MDFVMEIGRLSQDELAYELGIRGVSSVTTVDRMRKTLRQIIKIEKSDSFMWPTYPYSFEEDERALNEKYDELESLVGQFAGAGSSPEYKKLSSKFSHAMGRVNRSIPETQEHRVTKSAILVKFIELSSELSAKVKRLARVSTMEASMLNATMSMQDPPTDSSDDQEEVPTVSVGASFSTTPVIKPVPVMNWRLKYTGDNKSLSLGAFLERVEELRVARHISKDQLVKSALDLFADKALIWYRANRKTFNDWDEMVVALREEFQPPDYDDQLLDEIKRRTQGSNESLSLYISIMTNLFSRLSFSIPESTRIRIISKNMAPFYQSQLGLAEIKTLEELRSMGKKLETRKAYVEAYVPPPRRNQSLEPDLACMTPSTSQASLASTTTNPRPVRRCWNCGKTGHFSTSCNQQKKVHCYKCGEPNVITRNCTKCRDLNEKRVR